MDGCDIRELMQKRGTGYRCLVEVVQDHQPYTKEKLNKGTLGIAYDFWYWGGNLEQAMIAVQWKPCEGIGQLASNYCEKPNRPISEIRFLRELKPGEHCTNPACACVKKGKS